jgi:glycosyltransferase involved in cell wall biosynthesis
MRIGIDVRLAHWPGIGRYIEEVVAHMVQAHPETHFVLFDNAQGPATLRNYADPQLRTKLQAPNVEFHSTTIRPFSLHEPWALRKLVRAARIDVMHSPYINIPWLGRADPPLVVTLHDFRHPDLKISWCKPRTWLKRMYYEALTRTVLLRASTIISVSHFLAHQVKQFAPSAAPRITVIPHAAGAEFAPIDASQVQRELHALGVKQPYFLFVGTLKPHKNLLAVLHALASPSLPAHTHLAVAAQADPRYPEVALTIEKLGIQDRVHMLGHLEKFQLPALYNGAVATLLPSAYESFGLPVVESMACGTPVIASTQEALQEVGGTAGIYVTPQPNALADAMAQCVQTFASQPRPDQRCLERAHTYSWWHSAEQLHLCYVSQLRSRTHARKVS